VDEYGNVRELQVAGERPLTIYLDRHEVVTLMTLGTQPELLVLGYLKNQGLVDSIAQVRSVQVDWETEAAAVVTDAGATATPPELGRRTVTTGCGQGTIYGELREQLRGRQLAPQAPLRQSALYALLKNLNAYNQVYRAAGAVHGCALCQGEQVQFFVEDVGRHNAVDAIAGMMWLEGISGGDKLFYTTGRLTSEMVIKVVQMGIPVLLSRSGISRMGLEMAQQTGVVLIARAQRRHFLIYHGAEHLLGDVELPPKLEVAHTRRS